MYNIEFKFGIHETYRLSIPDEILDFSLNGISCDLVSLDDKALNESLSFSIKCKNLASVEEATSLEDQISSWLLKFGYETHTLLVFPKNNFKVTKDGVIETTLKLRGEMSFYVMHKDDKQLLLNSLENINIENKLFYEMYNNALGLKSEELKLIYLMSIIETVIAKQPKIPKEENCTFVKMIEELKDYAKELNADSDTLSLINSKLNLNKEMSIRKKLKCLIKLLKTKEFYCDLKPNKFIQECYSIRSDFAHSGLIKIPRKLEKYSLQNINSYLRDIVWQSIDMTLIK
jgi:hypothetical protein